MTNTPDDVYERQNARLHELEVWTLREGHSAAEQRLEQFRGAHAPGDGPTKAYVRSALHALAAHWALRDYLAGKGVEL